MELSTGFTSLIDGANAAIDTPLVSETQFVTGLNVSIRGGLVKTRPRFRKVASLGSTGVFRGAGLYRLNSGDTLAIAVDRGVQLFPLNSGVLSAPVHTFESEFDRAYFAQADKYLIVQNGVSDPVNWPLILDGATPVDATAVQVFDDASNAFKAIAALDLPDTKRLPVGSIMAYAHGRLFVVVDRVWWNGLVTGSAGWQTNLGRRFFLAGDILQPDNAQEVLGFTETDYLAEGGAMGPASEIGFIHGMAPFRNSSTGTGLGALVVFGRDGVCAFAINTPRTQWKDVDISQVLFTGPGTESPRSIVAVNDDLWFRARDGMRAIRYTTSSEAGSSGSLSSVSRSQEMAPTLALDTDRVRTYSSAVWVDNRLLFTTAGVDGTEPYFRAVVSLDGNVVGSLRGQAAPAYDGYWTGLKFLQVIRARRNGRENLFALVRGKGGDLELWELDRDAVYDGEDTPPLCRVVTRIYDWARPDLKELKSVDLWIRDMRGPISLTAYWRPDGYPLWNKCSTVSLDAPVEGLSQHRRRIPLVPIDGVGNPVTEELINRGVGFQFCLQWRGTMTLERAVFTVNTVGDEAQSLACGTEASVALLPGAGGVTLDDYSDYEGPP